MDITNQLLTESTLAQLLQSCEENHVGYVYQMSFTETKILTNDYWKDAVSGIPHNSFLIATAINPNKISDTHKLDNEILLLRVLEPVALPQDADLLKTRIEHNQRRTKDEVFMQDQKDGFDPITHDELQYGGMRCRILGTFYNSQGELRLGSDIENFMSSARLRVFKPRGNVLETIVNHVNIEIKRKSIEEAEKSGFKGLPSPIHIGDIRYTSTDRLHRGDDEPRVPVRIQPSDFLGRRTAVLGMTRTGKSNTVKTTVSSVLMAAKKDGIKVGQIIFDINGEYANANHQDDGSSLGNVFNDDCVRYRAIETKGFEDLRTNFYEEPASALVLLINLCKSDPNSGSSQDFKNFLESSLEEPEDKNSGEYKRWQVLKSIFFCIIYLAGYTPPEGFMIRFSVNEKIREQIDANIDPSKGISLDAAIDWFTKARTINKDNSLKSSSGKNWIDDTTSAYLNLLAKKSSGDGYIRGYSALNPYKNYHSGKRKGIVEKEIYQHVSNGKIVILDLSAGPVEIRTILSERIARYIFDESFKKMNGGEVPQNIVMYVEEAHNLIGKKEPLTTTWPRIAKEGAKARIAFVYATQEPSSIHPNILANTENWFVTHLNNDDELKVLGKFYDFSDFHESLKTAQDVGFARIKTLSSPFVIPTQIKRFTPSEIVTK